MNIRQQYSATVQPSPFVIKEYRTPQQYLDPSKIIEDRKNMKYKNRSPERFKPSKSQKQFFIEQLIKPLKQNPAPCKYQTTLNILSKKNQGPKVNDKNRLKVNKNTYIDQIQIKQQKQKAPGIGKYNLLTLTDFTTSKPKKKKNKLTQKRSYFDGKVIQSLQKPGPGQHNPHFSQKKINPDRTTYKFYKQKHQEQKLKLRRSLSAKLGPTSYKPLHADTFDSIKLKSKHPQPSKWSHGSIDIRKGLRSAQKYPSPAQYQLINQWSPGKTSDSRRISVGEIGKVDLFGRTMRSARSLNVYRD